MTLNTQPNLTRPDDFYEALIDMHRDFDDAQSQSANAQLILLLANHIGDHAVLLEAMQHARDGAARMKTMRHGCTHANASAPLAA